MSEFCALTLTTLPAEPSPPPLDCISQKKRAPDEQTEGKYFCEYMKVNDQHKNDNEEASAHLNTGSGSENANKILKLITATARKIHHIFLHPFVDAPHVEN